MSRSLWTHQTIIEHSKAWQIASRLMRLPSKKKPVCYGQSSSLIISASNLHCHCCCLQQSSRRSVPFRARLSLFTLCHPRTLDLVFLLIPILFSLDLHTLSFFCSFAVYNIWIYKKLHKISALFGCGKAFRDYFSRFFHSWLSQLHLSEHTLPANLLTNFHINF